MSIISPIKSEVQPNLDVLTHHLLHYLCLPYLLLLLSLLPFTCYQSRADNSYSPNVIP